MRAGKMLIGLILIGIVISAGDFCHAANYTGSVTIRPMAPTASWTKTLQPKDSATFSVTVINTESGYRLKSGPTAEITGQDILWTGGPTTFNVVNEAPEESSTQAKVACVWEPYGTGGGHGPRPPDINGLATGTAQLKVAHIEWGAMTPLVQVADGASTIAWEVKLVNDSGDLVSGISVTFTLSAGNGAWQISPSSGPGPRLNGTVLSAVSSRGSLKVDYTYFGKAKSSTSGEILFVRVVIDNYTSVTYDGLNSGSLVCRIDPSGPTPSSFSWSATWTTPAYNNPSVTFKSPVGESTIIQNAHWYSTAPSPGSAGAAFYDIYCTAEINGISVANETPASFVVGVYNPGGHCDPPGLKGSPFFTHTESNGLFICTGVIDFQRRDASVVNNYTSASQFHPKVQGHEEQHKEDYDIGYDNHLFYTEGELASMIVGLTSTNYSSLASMVGSKIIEYISMENEEINDTMTEMEDRAYEVSDLIQPYFVYQTTGM